MGVTGRLVTLLTEDEWVIVSDLARGIYAESHRVVLTKNGYTLAVLASGLDMVYPAVNRDLAEEIVERGGALVSEQPFGVPSRPVNLIQACRLQCGMSVATVVMQTDLTGGSMHTVRFTLLQGRFLVAPVPRRKLAEEPKNRGLVALTQSTRANLTDLLQVSGEYRQVLLGQSANHAPAFSVRSRADYPDFLRILCQRLRTVDDMASG